MATELPDRMPARSWTRGLRSVFLRLILVAGFAATSILPATRPALAYQYSNGPIVTAEIGEPGCSPSNSQDFSSRVDCDKGGGVWTSQDIYYGGRKPDYTTYWFGEWRREYSEYWRWNGSNWVLVTSDSAGVYDTNGSACSTLYYYTLYRSVDMSGGALVEIALHYKYFDAIYDDWIEYDSTEHDHFLE